MPGLPKIALARLKANPEAPKSSGAPLGPVGFQGAEHPDANLLAAFAEKALTEGERARVLNHLSQCADCREVAAFALPGKAVVAKPARVAAWRRWNPWLVFRWGAMAAVLGALTIVVVLHPGMWNGHPDISKETPLPVPAGNITSPRQTVFPPPSAQPAAGTAQDKAQVKARESANEMAAARKAPEPRLTRNARAARAPARQQVTMMASTRPPATIRAENVPGVNFEREEGKGGNGLTLRALPAPPSSPAPAAVTTALSEDAAKASAESQASPAALRATNQNAEVTPGRPGGFGGGGGAGGIRAAGAEAAPPAPTQATVRMSAQTAIPPMRASRKAVEVTTGPPASLWNVASDGKVQRSTDGGKSFAHVHVAHGIKFRAIAALGNNVWTGGTGGALFHSVDGGATWTRAGIDSAGNAVTETIVGIQVQDELHLTVITASGSQWVSEDGGQNWQKKP